MLKSNIIEASSFTKSRVDFNIPSLLTQNIKVCGLGVYGCPNPTYPADPILGQLAVISKILLAENGQVISQYDRRFTNLLKYKMLMESNTAHRSKERRVLGHNYGFNLSYGGVTSGATPYSAQTAAEGQIFPRICVDKKDISRVLTDSEDTKFAILDLKKCLGFLSGQWDSANSDITGMIPFHLFKNLKLSIEFAVPGQVATGATDVNQPYIIMDNVVGSGLESAFNNKSAQWLDLELEEIYLGNAQSSNKFLNSFYNKTLGNLHMMGTNANNQFAPYSNESVNLLVNGVPLFQQGGIDSSSKRCAFTQMAVGDLYIPVYTDRALDKIDPAVSANQGRFFEGDNANPTLIDSALYIRQLSYLAMPVQQKINSLQIQYSRAINNNIDTLLFFGEVVKVMNMDSTSNLPVISYV